MTPLGGNSEAKKKEDLETPNKIIREKNQEIRMISPGLEPETFSVLD